MEFHLNGRHPLLRNELRTVNGDRRELIIDARRLCFASPLDLAAATALAHTHAEAGQAISLLLPRCSDVTAYLQRMDLFKQLPDGTTYRGTVPDETRQDHSTKLLEVTSLSSATASEVNMRIGRVATASLGTDMGHQVFRGIGELIDNAVSHGSSDVGAFIAAQVYSGNSTNFRRLEVAICDTGVGVLSHLRRNPKHTHLSGSAEALTLALEPGISGTEEERGNGLPDLLAEAGGIGVARLVLRSGDGLMRTGRREHSATTVSLATGGHVEGTWAWLRVSFPP